MHTLILAAWLIAIECPTWKDHNRTVLNTVETKAEAIWVAGKIFDSLTDASKLECEINVSEVHAQGKPL